MNKIKLIKKLKIETVKNGLGEVTGHECWILVSFYLVNYCTLKLGLSEVW